jgi:dephospho-CoA kinase
MRKIIAVVGMPGSGKSLFSHYLHSQGLPVIRFGAVVTAEVERRGLPLNPENERLVREELRATQGMDAVARLSLQRIRKTLEQHEFLVIDGLYSFSEYKLLRREFEEGLCVVAVASQRALRYNRLANRPERPLTPAEALRRDFQEIETLEKGGPIAIADITVVNDGTADELMSKALNLAASFTVLQGYNP